MPYNDVEQFGEYVDLALEMRLPLVVVDIVCDFKINSESLCSGDRKKDRKMKLVDVNVL